MDERPLIDWDWIASHLDDLWALTVEHITLTVIARTRAAASSIARGIPSS